ncbi:hypothetical protein L483_13315 [Pseudomonas putida H8234]|nr:hypothetical protein L483_13315 [Pseudomonas putida H8234]
MKGTAGGVALAGEPLLKQALEAVRAHQKAVKDDAFAGEIERLRLLTDSLFQQSWTTSFLNVVAYQKRSTNEAGGKCLILLKFCFLITLPTLMLSKPCVAGTKPSMPAHPRWR